MRIYTSCQVHIVVLAAIKFTTPCCDCGHGIHYTTKATLTEVKRNFNLQVNGGNYISEVMFQHRSPKTHNTVAIYNSAERPMPVPKHTKESIAHNNTGSTTKAHRAHLRNKSQQQCSNTPLQYTSPTTKTNLIQLNDLTIMPSPTTTQALPPK